MKSRMRRARSEFVLEKKLQVAKRFDVPVCLKTIKIHPLIANLIASIGDVSSIQDIYFEELKVSDKLILKLIDLLERFKNEEEIRDNLLQILERASQKVSLKNLAPTIFQALLQNFDNRTAIDIFLNLVENYYDSFIEFLDGLDRYNLSLTDFFQDIVTDDMSILPELLYLSSRAIFKPEVKEHMHDWFEFLLSLFSAVEESEKIEMIHFFESLCNESPPLCKTFLKSASFEDVLESSLDPPKVTVRMLSFIISVSETVRIKPPAAKKILKIFEPVTGNSEYPVAAAEFYVDFLLLSLRLYADVLVPFIHKHDLLTKILTREVGSSKYRVKCAALLVCYENHLPDADFGNDCTRDWMENVFLSLSSVPSDELDEFNTFFRKYKALMSLGPTFPIDAPFLATLSGSVGSNQAGIALIDALRDAVSV